MRKCPILPVLPESIAIISIARKAYSSQLLRKYPVLSVLSETIVISITRRKRYTLWENMQYSLLSETIAYCISITRKFTVHITISNTVHVIRNHCCYPYYWKKILFTRHGKICNTVCYQSSLLLSVLPEKLAVQWPFEKICDTISAKRTHCCYQYYQKNTVHITLTETIQSF